MKTYHPIRNREEPIEPEEGSSILAANLESALYLAIQALAATEARYPQPFKSCQRAGFEANLAYLRKHGILDIRA